MKPLSVIVFYCFLFFSNIFSLPVADAGPLNDCPDGLVGYWRLDETVEGIYADHMAANDGMCAGGGCPGRTAGVIDSGQAFDGHAAITIAADPAFNWSAGNSFSIELWMRRAAGIGDLEVFVGREAAGGLSWCIGINSAGHAEAWLQAADGSGPSQPLTGAGSDPLPKQLTNGSDIWHHVAFVRNAQLNQNILYVDGRQEALDSYVYTGGFASDTAPLTVGSWNGGSHFNGALDEVAVYNRALTENEIKSHYFIAREYCGFYDKPIKIMPLGDSITSGVWTEIEETFQTIPAINMRIGYRYTLWGFLGSSLYWSDFIGNELTGFAFDPASDFDAENAGFGGNRDDELNTLLATGFNPFTASQLTDGPYLDTYNTDLVLLHIGTNSLNIDPADVSNILDRIDEYSQNVTVLLARIIGQSPQNGTVTTFNQKVADMADARIADGDKIIIVDMENGAGLNYATDIIAPYVNGDMYDQLHPNPSGYQKMAAKWYESLAVILPQSEPPAITSIAPDYAVKDRLFTYQPIAVGLPFPDFSLALEPAGMTIDPISALIQWTPSQTGDHQGILRAENWAGADEQIFTIRVSANQAPMITSTAPDQAVEGTAYVYATTAEDTENDPLIWSLNGAPAWMTLEPSSGVVSGTPPAGSTGSQTFTLFVSDGYDGFDSQTVSLTISSAVPSGPPASNGDSGSSGCFINIVHPDPS